MNFSKSKLAASICLLSLAVDAVAQDEDVVELDTFVAEEEVSDDLGMLQTEPVDSVFGFGKTILETPRAVSSVSSEFLDAFAVGSINDIVSFVPGSFTTSFFGVAGSLDVRGTPADNYFRGVKRISNDGIFPTPIGATDRIDVVRGPMSPISGPSRVGGALNFVPKSARAETGQYMQDPSGLITYTTGSWDKSIIGFEVGGPTKIADKSAGYYIFAEVDNSGSYYNNDFNDQNLLQASFNVDLTPSTRIEFGGMHQEWDGHENGGWNRVTQDLIDNGTYITGQPEFTPVDANADGLMNDAEIEAGFATLGGVFDGGEATCFGGSIAVFCQDNDIFVLDPSELTAGSIPAGYGIVPTGTTQLDNSEVLISVLDVYQTEATTLYFDVIHDMGNGWTMTNKLFYDSVESRNSDAYGFSKAGDTWLIEDQLIFAKMFEGENFVADIQVSPSIRYEDAWYANDFTDEIFDRTDLSVGYTPASTQGSSVNNGIILEPWGVNDFSTQTQYGMAFLADTKFADSLSILLGARYDYVDIEGTTGSPATFRSTAGQSASDSDTGASYSLSVSYETDFGVVPYVTVAEQSTILFGTHDAVELGNIIAGTWLGDSEMKEAGIKATMLDGRLFVAGAVFEQERISINSNVGESNEALRSDGYELEARWVVNDKMSIMGTYSSLDVVRTDLGGSMFTYLGAADFTQIDPTTVWGGIISGVVQFDGEPDRGGIPDSVFSLSGTYNFSDELAGTISWTSVEEVHPSPTAMLTLPAYDLVNMGISYTTDEYFVKANVNNITDEQYFRANFPGLYGNLTVLPEKPRNYTVEFGYKF